MNQELRIKNKKLILGNIFFVMLFLILTPTTTHAQSVDLIWQGETYTTPFYKGLALWTTESRVTLVAIPQGLGGASNLYYKWTKNGTVLGNINGVGRNHISFVDPIISRPQEIKVEIISSDKETVLAGASTLIAPDTSSLAIYENDPLYGFMFHKETNGTYPLKNKEITFTMFPFFSSIDDRENNNLNYKWQTSDTGGGAETGNSITYLGPEGVTGSAEIKASFSNTKNITQSAGKKFLVRFGTQ